MKDIQLGEAGTGKEMKAAESFDEEQDTLVEIRLRITQDLLNRVDDYFETYTLEGDILTIVWPLDEWVYSFILSLGCKAEVLAPLSLREVIKKWVNMMVKLYQ